MAIINARADLGDFANIVAKVQVPTDIKSIVCNILAGNGVFNPLEGASICLNIALGQLINLNGITAPMQEALNDLAGGMNDFLEHSGVNNALNRVNQAISQAAAIYSMVNFCSGPITPPQIPNLFQNAIGSYLGKGQAILDAIGGLIPDNVSACLGEGGFNFGLLDPNSLFARIKAAADSGANMDDLVQEVRNTLTEIQNLIDQENTGDSDSQRVLNALGTAQVLKATFQQASAYKIDEENSVFEFFVDPDVIALLDQNIEYDPTLERRVPVYDYCGNLIRYDVVVEGGNPANDGVSTHPDDNVGAAPSGSVFGEGAGPSDPTLGGGTGSLSSSGGTGGGGSDFPSSLFVENLDTDATFASTTGLVIKVGNTPRAVSIEGVLDQVNVANADGSLGNPLIGLATNPIVPGVQAITVPKGQTGDRSATPVGGQLRYNTDTNKFEVYMEGFSWHEILTDVDYAILQAQIDNLVNIYAPIAVVGDLREGNNVGTGLGVFRDRTANVLNFRSLVAGTGISLTTNAGDEIVINSTVTSPVQSAANVGTGEGVYKELAGTQLRFKTLVAGTSMSFTAGPDTITIDGPSELTDPYLIKSGTQTTDSSPTTMPFNGGVLTVPTDVAWFFSATFIARRTGGTVERNAFKLEGVVDNTGGIVGLVGPAAYTVYQNNATQWNVSVQVIGQNLVFRVIGEDGKTINWTGHIRYQPVGESISYQ